MLKLTASVLTKLYRMLFLIYLAISSGVLPSNKAEGVSSNRVDERLGSFCKLLVYTNKFGYSRFNFSSLDCFSESSIYFKSLLTTINSNLLILFGSSTQLALNPISYSFFYILTSLTFKFTSLSFN